MARPHDDNGAVSRPEVAMTKSAPPRRGPASIRIRYADTDAMGVVYYGNYLSFFETGRVEAMRQVGASYVEMVARGMHSPVVEATVRYHRPAYFDDVLLIYAWVVRFTAAQFYFEYEIRRESDGELIATGHSRHACIDATTRRPVRIPVWAAETLDKLRRDA